MAESLTYTELAAKAGISNSYAFEIINGTRKPSLATAVKIYDATGLQFGALVGLSLSDIEAARRIAA